MSAASQDRNEQPKKPRHRHSAFQLAALNELYDKNEHPSLEERTSLAERLGMETKTVNSWFQNKRASSKKRHKGSSTAAGTNNGKAGSSSSTKTNTPVELPPISALIASVSAPPSLGPLPPHEYDDYSDDEHVSRLSHAQQQSLFYAGNPQHRHLFEAENHLPRKARSRPSAVQTEELRKVYDVNPHPSKEEREELGDRIGMRYQSVTNWFQNQRSIAKKRKEEEDAHAAVLSASSSSKSRTFSPFPPAASAAHPSLAVPPATGHPSLGLPLSHSGAHAPVPRARRSSAPTSHGHGHNSSHFHLSASRSSSPRASPYRTPSDRSRTATRPHPRPRRARPEPHQLEALKKLFRRTATPSIEERGALALEIGMDVGKVTNWFRNLRQTARKRARARRGWHGDGEEDELEDGELDCDDRDVEHDVYMEVDADDVSLATYTMHSRSVSRAGTPMHSTTSSAPSPLMHAAHRHLPHPPPYSLEDQEALYYMAEMQTYLSLPPKVRKSEMQQLYGFGRDPPSAVGMHPSLHAHVHSDPDAYADGDSRMGSEEDFQEAVTPSPESSPPPSVSVSETYAELEKAVVRKAVVGRGMRKYETG